MVVLAAAMTTVAPAEHGLAEGPKPSAGEPAYPSSPWRGIIDGNGQAIPCRCLFGGREWQLGEMVCMSTHLGTVLTRCDLVLNNTSWVPTGTPCTTSGLGSKGRSLAAAR